MRFTEGVGGSLPIKSILSEMIFAIVTYALLNIEKEREKIGIFR